jgi:predicted ATP-dependent serine protease|tara:strand:- start:264 stop:1235 length:972 start_codon:yes stop_codon:yes gene_type:complete
MSDGFKLVNGFDFYKESYPETDYLIEELLTTKSISVLSGDTGLGKSLIAHQVGIALAAGCDEILGYKIPKKRRVLYLNFELSMQELHQRHKLIADGLGCSDNLENFTFNRVINKSGIFTNSWVRIKETIKDNDRFDLIIIDNLYASTNGDDESNIKLKLILANIFDVAGIYDNAVLLINHHRKHNEEDPLTIGMIRGGSNLVNAMDTVIQLGRSLQDFDLRYFKITKNRGKSPHLLKPIGLSFDEDTLLFSNLGVISENHHLSRLDNIQEDIIENLPEEFKTAMFVQSVVDKGLDRKTAYNWLKSFRENQVIEKKSHGKYVKC